MEYDKEKLCHYLNENIPSISSQVFFMLLERFENIKDHSEKIKEVIKDKGLHNKPTVCVHGCGNFDDLGKHYEEVHK